MADFPDLTDVDTWTDEDLDRLRAAVAREAERRYTLTNAPDLAAQTAARYRDAVEAALPPLAEGEHRPWTQPTGAHDVYPRGAVVAHAGRVWESQHPANAWEPGGAGVPAGLWKDVTKDAPAPAPAPTGPAWKAGEAVKVGDVRVYEGAAYTAVQAHTTQAGWEPPKVASLWKKA